MKNQEPWGFDRHSQSHQRFSTTDYDSCNGTILSQESPLSYTIGPNTINTMWAAPTVWGETWRVLSAVATIMGAGVDGIYDDVTSQRNNTVKMITFIQL